MSGVLVMAPNGGRETCHAQTSVSGQLRQLLSSPVPRPLSHQIMVWVGHGGEPNLPASWITVHLGGPRVLLRGPAVFTGVVMYSPQELVAVQYQLLGDLYTLFLRELRG